MINTCYYIKEISAKTGVKAGTILRSISTLTGNSEMKYDDNYKISKYIGYWIGWRK